MTTYILLMTWTDQGVRNARNSPERLDAAKEMLRQMGGEFLSFYMTMGEFDLIAVYEAPDDAVAARFTLLLQGLGNVRTRTMKAFPERAYREIVAGIG